MSKIDSMNIKGVAATALDSVLIAKQSAEDLAHAVSAKLEGIRTGAADALHSGATSVRSASDIGAAALADAGESVARKLDVASSYVNGRDSESVARSVRRTVSRHPICWLAIATAAGFCAGRAISRARATNSHFAKEELR